MTVHFSKYQGTGNDFILIDDREEHFPTSNAIIQKLCNRRFGIGADGLILIQGHPTLDYRMVYYNSDGSQSLCGNGSRCGFAFARRLGLVMSKAKFETVDGIHEIKFEHELIHLQLFDVHRPNRISETEWYLNTGSPHHMVLVDDLQNEDIVSKGRAIRNLPSYSSQNGVNVNFVQFLQNRAKIRTYERGVENETLSCGTGAVAVGLLAGDMGFGSPFKVETEGGELVIFFQLDGTQFTHIWLAGPAEKVYEGSVTI